MIDTSMYQGGTLANPAGAFLQGVQMARQMRAEDEQRKLQQQQAEALTEQRQALAEERQGRLQAAQVEQAREQRLRQLFSDPSQVTPGALYSIVGPEKGADILKGLAALDEQHAKTFQTTQGVIGAVLGGIKALPEGLRADGYTAARQNLLQRGLIRPEDAPEQYDPAFLDQTERALLTPEQRYQTDHPTLVQTDPTKDLSDPKTGAVVRPGVPAVVPEKKYPVTVAGPDGRPMQRLVTEAELTRGVPAYQARDTKEPTKFWVMRDGKPLRVSEADYRPGDQPASTREYGRPVTSGDASDLADFDTTLDDLKVLRDTIAPTDPKTGQPIPSVTGTSAAIGAAMPAWATDLLGWGADAKKKQALIDRVKQVIGKTLEGGVLRKEDEAKYEKILPTIKDASPVVISKLNGLETAIKKRKDRRVDALDDAGYDTSRFRSRTSGNKVGRFTVEVENDH